MRFTHAFILAALSLGVGSAFSSCEDETSTLGSSLVGSNENSEVVIDSIFTVTGHSFRDSAILSRSATQLLGRLNAVEYGSFSSDFVTQFMPSGEIDTAGVSVNDIDSIKLFMFFATGDFTGDSLVPMGFKVYPLVKQLETPIYSDFNPRDYYSESNCWTPQSQIYTGNALYNDSIHESYSRAISVKLPVEFAKSFYSEYINNPASFATPQAFAKFFPGIYVKNSFGTGRVTNIVETKINLYYTKHSKVTVNDVERDTLLKRSNTYMGVTPEVISNNILSVSMSDQLTAMAAEGKTLLVSPAGYNAKIEFPIKDIIARYKDVENDKNVLSVINALTLQIPVETIENNYNIAPPENVLFILSKDADKFFSSNSITDDKTSFLSTYNTITNSYYVTALRSYLISLLDKEEITPDDYTFSIIPVSITTESSNSGSSYYYSSAETYITGIQPYISTPAMCRLKLDEAKIRFTYTKQSIKN